MLKVNPLQPEPKKRRGKKRITNKRRRKRRTRGKVHANQSLGPDKTPSQVGLDLDEDEPTPINIYPPN